VLKKPLDGESVATVPTGTTADPPPVLQARPAWAQFLIDQEKLAGKKAPSRSAKRVETSGALKSFFTELPKPLPCAALVPAARTTASRPSVLVADDDAPLRSLAVKASTKLERLGKVAARREAAAEKENSEAKPLTADDSNAAFIVKNILNKCSSMDFAEPYFSKLKADTPRVQGRILTVADVDEARRRCRRIWNGSAEKARGGSEVQRAATVKERSLQGVSRNDVISKRPVAKSKGDISNVRVIVQHVMRTCDELGKADAFFTRFLHIGATSKLGTLFAEEDVGEARSQCQKHYAGTRKIPKSRLSNVDVVVKYIKSRFNSMSSAARFYYILHKTAGETNQLSLILSVKDVKEARLQCSSYFEEQAAWSKSSSSSSQGNVDAIIKHVLKKFATVAEAQAFFESLHTLEGARKFGFNLGTVFTQHDATEAWLRCTACFDEQDKGECSDSGSDCDEPGPGGSKSKKKRKGKNDADEEDDEYDGLSGEEGVDEEQYDEQAEAELRAGIRVTASERELAADGYKSQSWIVDRPNVLPGHPGFNSRVIKVMHDAQLGDSSVSPSDKESTCPPLQLHQQTVSFLLHPKSPVSRLLVDHPTGSGKTREMIQVLDNYFYDPRPKVPIFPRDAVCRNFYAELLRWPNRYRDYFCCERPLDAATASGHSDWKARRGHMWDLSSHREVELRRLCVAIRDVLEMKGMSYKGMMRMSCRKAFRKKHPGEPMPLVPLRAISYTSAGGSFSAIAGGPGGVPASALMKIGYQSGSGNVYGNKVVLLDEAHNLVRVQSQYAEQLHRLRDLLDAAQNMVLAGFTGTPIINEPWEGRQLLDIIKGKGASDCDEGFLSAFPTRPRSLFPLSLPEGIPDGLLTVQRMQQLVRKVELHGEALKVYDLKRHMGLTGQRLRNYCNISVYAGSLHDGKHGSKARILANPEDCCPKLQAVALAVADSSQKAFVMTGRTSGYAIMLELLRRAGATSDPPFQVATMTELSEFNHVSNLRGEKYRVLVADAVQCSEGVSVLAVRRSFLTDIPASHSQFIQQCGRAIRMYGHRGLPEDEQTVLTQLFVATLPRWMADSPLACWAYRAQKGGQGASMEQRAKLLVARLHRNGIESLPELKARLDAYGDAKHDLAALASAPREKLMLVPEDVPEFLEQNGLWEEARLLRGSRDKTRGTTGLEKNFDPEEEAAETAEDGTKAKGARKPRALVQLMQELYLESSEQAASSTWRPETSDEEALRQLAQRAEEIAPALAAMRSLAVDREMIVAVTAEPRVPPSEVVSEQSSASVHHTHTELLPDRHLAGGTALLDVVEPRVPPLEVVMEMVPDRQVEGSTLLDVEPPPEVVMDDVMDVVESCAAAMDVNCTEVSSSSHDDASSVVDAAHVSLDGGSKAVEELVAPGNPGGKRKRLHGKTRLLQADGASDVPPALQPACQDEGLHADMPLDDFTRDLEDMLGDALVSQAGSSIAVEEGVINEEVAEAVIEPAEPAQSETSESENIVAVHPCERAGDIELPAAKRYRLRRKTAPVHRSSNTTSGPISDPTNSNVDGFGVESLDGDPTNSKVDGFGIGSLDDSMTLSDLCSKMQSSRTQGRRRRISCGGA